MPLLINMPISICWLLEMTSDNRKRIYDAVSSVWRDRQKGKYLEYFVYGHKQKQFCISDYFCGLDAIFVSKSWWPSSLWHADCRHCVWVFKRCFRCLCCWIIDGDRSAWAASEQIVKFKSPLEQIIRRIKYGKRDSIRFFVIHNQL